jgi:hypothetical protein
VKLHTVFLRDGCILPAHSDICQIPFCNGWTEASGTLVTQLDFGIRGAGWHFMWIAGSHSSRGMGRTRDAAINRALVRALDEVKVRFNAAELGWMQVISFLGFQIARVTLHARHIQQQTSLDSADESRLQQLPAL